MLLSRSTWFSICCVDTSKMIVLYYIVVSQKELMAPGNVYVVLVSSGLGFSSQSAVLANPTRRRSLSFLAVVILQLRKSLWKRYDSYSELLYCCHRLLHPNFHLRVWKHSRSDRHCLLHIVLPWDRRSSFFSSVRRWSDNTDYIILMIIPILLRMTISCLVSL